MDILEEFKASTAKVLNDVTDVTSFETIDAYFNEDGVNILDVYNLSPKKCVFDFKLGKAYLVEDGVVSYVRKPDTAVVGVF